MNTLQTQTPVFKPVIFFILFICLIYSNTLNSGWHLDDYNNITENPDIQITLIDKDAIINSLYAAPQKEVLYRPLAFFSFALNWYFGKDDVAGYHIVNTAIHILTALFLFHTILLLFQTPNMKGRETGSIYFIALLSAMLWAIHPIQIQAVTYIVQRMAAMAALFYTIGLFCYLKARLTSSSSYRLIFYIFCIVAFFLGVGSKNNAILLPASILLLEVTFFRDLTQKWTQKKTYALIFFGLLVVAAAVVFLLYDRYGGLFLEIYDRRTFTMYQRLLTQPGIVLFYLSQIFYPVVSRFSIAHDVTVSTSLFTPWYTMPAIVLVLGLIVFALWRIKRTPLLSFAILFFFGNHVVESTILPLEMVFEHRNYLPSLFLFVPVAGIVENALNYYRPFQKPMFYFLVLSVCGVLISLGMSTYVRNWDWRSEKSLWEDAMEKAPQSARPAQNLAWGYYRPAGQLEKAIALYEKALELHDNEKNFKYYSYNNLAGIYFSQGDYKKAGQYAAKGLEIVPDNVGLNLMFCNSIAMLGHYEEALAYINYCLEQEPDNIRFLYFKGFLLLKMEKSLDALPFFRKCLKASPDKPNYLREIGICFTQMGDYDRGFWFLKRAQARNPNEIGILIGLIDNRMRKGRPKDSEKWAERLIRVTGVDNIEQKLKQIAKDPLGINFSYQKTALAVSMFFADRAEKYTETAIRLENEFELSK